MSHIYQQNQSTRIAIRKTPTVKLVMLSILTGGIYWYIWLWKLTTDINKLLSERGKCIHRYNWFCSLIGLQVISIIMSIKGIQNEFIINIAGLIWLIINLLLTLQFLKNIERYVREKFEINLHHNVFGWLFFGSFYINYKINRLNLSIKKEIRAKIKKLKYEENL